MTVWGLTASADPGIPNPFPRELVVREAVTVWDFAEGVGQWRALHDCEISAADGKMRIRCHGPDPYLVTGVSFPEPESVLRLRLRAESGGRGQVFWSTPAEPGFAEARSRNFALRHDGEWHVYEIPIEAGAPLTGLRLDPGTAPGMVEVDEIAIHRGGLHPLEILGLRWGDAGAEVLVRNHGLTDRSAVIDGRAVTLAAESESAVRLDWGPGEGPLVRRTVSIAASGLPPIHRPFWDYRPSQPFASVTRSLGDVTLRIATDGSVVEMSRGDRPFAALAPLVQVSGRLPRLRWSSASAVRPATGEPPWPVILEGDGVTVQLSPHDDGSLDVAIDAGPAIDTGSGEVTRSADESEVSGPRLEGPVVRVFGTIEQGLLSGVEYLGQGETSSSKLDIETEEHMRAFPDPMDLTMPLMALLTDRGGVSMLWDPPSRSPSFAVPDFIDFAPGQRMSLRADREIRLRLRLTDGWGSGERLEDAILWAIRDRGLPELPPRPRSSEDQEALSLAAYRGLMHDPDTGGWFHAVVPGGRRMPAAGAPLADCVSTIYRLTGRLPDTESLQPGGAHVANDASFFLSGRAGQWLRFVDGRAQGLRARQRRDGSFRYEGKYRRGHFEDTASGICSLPASLLMEHAWQTGNGDSLHAGLSALEFVKRFRTPRGAQTWEVPLHTPDLMAAAQLVWAYTRAYELTGDRDHLVEARRWAIRGLPFVYQWSTRPIMAYATIAVYGATDWVAPNWIGLPVQWCGTVYAYALLMLAEHDDTLDWRRLSEGITRCAEQMQYPAGDSVGCLPDAFSLADQGRLPADINPAVLVSLRRLLDGRLDALAVASDARHRVVSPFPLRLDADQAIVRGVPGAEYQILVNGRDVIDVRSVGTDVIDLDSANRPPRPR